MYDSRINVRRREMLCRSSPNSVERSATCELLIIVESGRAACALTTLYYFPHYTVSNCLIPLNAPSFDCQTWNHESNRPFVVKQMYQNEKMFPIPAGLFHFTLLETQQICNVASHLSANRNRLFAIRELGGRNFSQYPGEPKWCVAGSLGNPINNTVIAVHVQFPYRIVPLNRVSRPVTRRFCARRTNKLDRGVHVNGGVAIMGYSGLATGCPGCRHHGIHRTYIRAYTWRLSAALFTSRSHTASAVHTDESERRRDGRG